MADNKDLEEIAKNSTDDFYELLGVTPDAAEEATIKRAYRKSSVKYHPDKNPDDKTAADKFILLGIARDILIEPKFRDIYDRERGRRREQKQRDDRMSARKREMKEALERSEREGLQNGLKRTYTQMNDKERREQQLAADTRRLKEEFMKKRRAEASGATATAADVQPKPAASNPPVSTPSKPVFRPSGSLHKEGAAAGTPKFSFSPKTATLEEATHRRLREFQEKKKLKEQILKQEAEEKAA